jgi:hypothetical protein
MFFLRRCKFAQGWRKFELPFLKCDRIEFVGRKGSIESREERKFHVHMCFPSAISVKNYGDVCIRKAIEGMNGNRMSVRSEKRRMSGESLEEMSQECF